MPIAAVILAAGGSRRLGRPKQLEPWGDTNLLGHVVARTSEFPVEEVWVVVGYEADRILAETDLGTAGVVENPEWEEGIASSIRVGLDALTRLSRCDQALIVIGDQPAVPVEVVDALLASHAGSDKPVSVPKYRYTSGNPVLVDRLLHTPVRTSRSVSPSTAIRRGTRFWSIACCGPASCPSRAMRGRAGSGRPTRNGSTRCGSPTWLRGTWIPRPTWPK